MTMIKNGRGQLTIKMNNPCSECIVTAMCEDHCDDLTDYIYTLTKLKYNLIIYSPFLLALWFRRFNTSEDIDEVYAQVAIKKRWKGIGTYKFAFLMNYRGISLVDYNDVPMNVPMRKGLLYYSHNYSECSIYLGYNRSWSGYDIQPMLFTGRHGTWKICR